MCVFPLLLQLALADTYLGSLSLSSFGSRRPLALTMAGSSGCGGPRATPGLGHLQTSLAVKLMSACSSKATSDAPVTMRLLLRTPRGRSRLVDLERFRF
jgi:hypothetical protein